MEATAAAIADPTRRRVLELVRDRELAAGEIAGALEISRRPCRGTYGAPRGRAAAERRQGRLHLYRADPTPLAELRGWLDEYWSTAGRPENACRGGSMTETVMTPVVCAVDIDAPREKVFSLFTTPDELVRW